MSAKRPVVLSVAGFDPCGGAGLLSDVKTLEQLEVYGLSACTAITYQNDEEFIGLDWLSVEQIEQQIFVLQNRFYPQAIKIGIVENLKILSRLLDLLRSWVPDAFILWDPILKASAGFEFHPRFEGAELSEIFPKLSLITPNSSERRAFVDDVEAAKELSLQVAVLVTGESDGHEVKDRLFVDGNEFEFQRAHRKGFEKHGSGCVFSSALCAFRVSGCSLEESAFRAGEYTAQFLQSSSGQLGYHKNIGSDESFFETKSHSSGVG